MAPGAGFGTGLQHAFESERTYILRPDLLAMIVQRVARILTALADKCGTCVPLAQLWVPTTISIREGQACIQLTADKSPFILHNEQGDMVTFRELSCKFSFPRGRGLPGRVWATGATEVVQNIKEFPSDMRQRNAKASDNGENALKGLEEKEVVGIPVYLQNGLAMVLELFVSTNGVATMIDILNLVDDMLLEAGLDSKGMTKAPIKPSPTGQGFRPTDFLQRQQVGQHMQQHAYALQQHQQYPQQMQEDQATPLWQTDEVLAGVSHQVQEASSFGVKRSFHDQEPVPYSPTDTIDLSTPVPQGSTCREQHDLSAMCKARPSKLNRVQMSCRDLTSIAS
mmetsp:Transcript_13580/g.49391  ORF Transcript_13580/g.49391 Transcript_13580/m.49391 type:complete len:339 (+) Transcript_13580:240-1256(+)|eukprot:scaffold1056_cov564-Prasinococcus_capsulatus_cf.AAC.18